MRLLAQKDLFPFLSNLFRCYFSHLISLIIRISLTLCQHAHYTCILTPCQYVFSFILGSSNNVNPNQSICRSSLTAACSESYLHSASPSLFPVVRTIVKQAKNGILRKCPPGSFLKNPLNTRYFSPLMYLRVTLILRSPHE